MEKVYQVSEVQLHILKSRPPQLDISADGTVRTSGWKNAELSPYVYVTPPEDGIQEFDFVAEPPDGVVSQVITPISANTIMEEIPDWLKGVRVYAETNQVEETLSTVTS